jgi:hypothetical protein
MTNHYLGVPAYWKTRRFRFRCPQCKAEGWHGVAGDIPQHARPDGRDCHAAHRARRLHMTNERLADYQQTIGPLSFPSAMNELQRA